MNTCIRRTLAVIEQRISLLERLATEIRTLLNGDLYPGSSGNKARPQAPRRRKRQPSLTAPRAAKPKPGRRSRDGSLVDAVRSIVAGRDGKFTRTVMQAIVLERHPELANRIGDLGVALIDMANHGELLRNGVGRGVTYQRAQLKPPGAQISSTEQAYREFRSAIPAPKSTE